jgi:predicted transcriptional regulator of viral defense system
LELGKLASPVVLRYDIGRIGWSQYKAHSYEGLPLPGQRETLDTRAFLRIERELIENGVLSPIPGLPERSAYTLIGAGAPDRNAIICSIDPFCYLSHLSAMEFHGLTDRMPEQIYVSSPPGKSWMGFAEERMRRDLGEDLDAYRVARLPRLQRSAVAKIAQRPVHRYSSAHQGAYRAIKGSSIRVATIGRTFLDMLRESDLCGGISHVIGVFREHAASNRRLIFDEFDQHGGPIDKVRCGYILEELCSIRDPRIDSWVAFAARGGSRRLDPSSDYEPRFSERWMISINVPTADE